MLNSGEVDRKDLCAHELTFGLCSSCQILPLIQCEKEIGVIIPKDLNRYIFSTLNGKQKRFEFTFRFAADHELVSGDPFEFESLYAGIYPASKPFQKPDDPQESDEERPPQEEKDLREFKVVFLGQEEAWRGFLCALVYKYGECTIRSDVNDFPPDINPEQRWHFSADVDQCIFHRHPEAAGFIQLEDGEFESSLSTTDCDQFIQGFLKGLDMEIAGVYVIPIVEEITLFRKTERHTTECEMCNGTGVDSEMGCDIEKIPRETKVTQCEAFWFFTK